MKARYLIGAAAAAILPVFNSFAAYGSTIADIYTDGNGTYTGESGTVTEILNTNSTIDTFTIQDSTGSVLAYAIPKTTFTPTVGEVIDFGATNSEYQDAPELVASGFSATEVSTGTAPAPAVLTIAEFNAAGNGSNTAYAPYGESIVELDDVTFPTPPASIVTNTTYTISDSTGTTSLYAYKSDSAVAAGATASNAANPTGYSGTYDIVGYVDEYYGAPEIYPLSITAVSVPEPASVGLIAVGSVALLSRRRRAVTVR